MIDEIADKEGQVASLGLRSVLFASLLLILFVIIAALVKNKSEKLKTPLFTMITACIVIPTFILFGSTIYLNVTSDSKGPVHWHTGIEFWSCGAEVELRDPTGFLSNKIGTSTYHEHNDKFMHLEGVVIDREEDSGLQKFMRVTGGYLEKDRIGIPVNDSEDSWFVSDRGDNKVDGDKQRPENFNIASGAGEWVSGTEKGKVLELVNGRTCGGSEGDPAEVQVFVYTFNEENDTYSQRKLEDPRDYVMRDKAILGPPSDCVIVEYDSPKAKTDKLCQQYGVKDKKRCVEFGVSSYNEELCYIEEVEMTGGVQ